MLNPLHSWCLQTDTLANNEDPDEIPPNLWGISSGSALLSKMKANLHD